MKATRARVFAGSAAVGAAVLALSLLGSAQLVPASAAAGAVPTAVPAASPAVAASVTVGLKPAWKVTAASQLSLSSPGATCRVTGLVRRSGRPATAARIRCTGPVGATVALTVAVKSVRGARVRVLVRFPAPATATPDQLLGLAPLRFSVNGSQQSVGTATFVVPNGWTRRDASNAASFDATVSGQPAQLFVFAPVHPDLSAAPTSTLQQLLDTAQSLFPSGPVLTGQFGGAPDTDVHQGTTGYGFPYVGLTLGTADLSFDVDATLVVFSESVAVPVLMVRPNLSSERFGGAYALVLQTLTVPGARGNLAAYEKSIVGSWALATSSAAAVDVFAANGRYAFAVGTSISNQIGDWIHTTTSAWAGDGAYAVSGPVLAIFPTSGARPSSTLIRMETETIKASTTTRTELLCQMGASDKGLYEVCYRRQM